MIFQWVHGHSVLKGMSYFVTANEIPCPMVSFPSHIDYVV